MKKYIVITVSLMCVLINFKAVAGWDSATVAAAIPQRSVSVVMTVETESSVQR